MLRATTPANKKQEQEIFIIKSHGGVDGIRRGRNKMVSVSCCIEENKTLQKPYLKTKEKGNHDKYKKNNNNKIMF